MTEYQKDLRKNEQEQADKKAFSEQKQTNAKEHAKQEQTAKKADDDDITRIVFKRK